MAIAGSIIKIPFNSLYWSVLKLSIFKMASGLAVGGLGTMNFCYSSSYLTKQKHVVKNK